MRRVDSGPLGRLEPLGTLPGGHGTAALVLSAAADPLSKCHVARSPALDRAALVDGRCRIADGLGAPARLANAAVVAAALAGQRHARWQAAGSVADECALAARGSAALAVPLPTSA